MILVLGSNLFWCAVELETARADIRLFFFFLLGLCKGTVWNSKKGVWRHGRETTRGGRERGHERVKDKREKGLTTAYRNRSS